MGTTVGKAARVVTFGLTVIVLAVAVSACGSSSRSESSATSKTTAAASATTQSSGANATSTTAATGKAFTGAEATMSGALKGHFDLTANVTCGDSAADGISANAAGTVAGAAYTLAVQVFVKPTAPQDITLPSTAASVRVFNVGSDGRAKDQWSAGRPAIGKGKVTVSGKTPFSYHIDADLWKVDTTGTAADNSTTNVTVTEKVTCPA